MHPKSAVLQTMHLVCVWKRIGSRERNSVPESRHASLYSVKVIKMSRLTIDRFLILCSLHGLLCSCKTDRETDCTTFLSLETKDFERGQLRCTWNCTWNPCVFQLHLSVRVWEFFVCVWPKACGGFRVPGLRTKKLMACWIRERINRQQSFRHGFPLLSVRGTAERGFTSSLLDEKFTRQVPVSELILSTTEFVNW